jgi:hypothetical protein
MPVSRAPASATAAAVLVVEMALAVVGAATAITAPCSRTVGLSWLAAGVAMLCTRS